MSMYSADSEIGIDSFSDEDVHVYDLTYINSFMCTDVCPCKDVPTKY